ncbi:MAG TPA: hypothetical protein ENK84_08905, partial [Desulfobulbus sp.]|nr:hypothetical protein [Desulfobulbus sp.]
MRAKKPFVFANIKTGQGVEQYLLLFEIRVSCAWSKGKEFSCHLLPRVPILIMEKKQLVLIGGGHAHMMLLANLAEFVARGIAVTVIQPSRYHYYSGMGAGMLGGTYTADEIRFQTKTMVEKQGGRFILGRAAWIDAANREVVLEQAGKRVPFDVLSCNAGSQVPFNTLSLPEGGDIFPVKPIEVLARARERIIARGKSRSLHVAIVGGGPSAMEIAGNVQQLAHEKNLLP